MDLMIPVARPHFRLVSSPLPHGTWTRESGAVAPVRRKKNCTTVTPCPDTPAVGPDTPDMEFLVHIIFVLWAPQSFK